MKALLRIRDGARRLVLELTVLGLLAVVFMTVLPDGRAVRGWDFAAPVLAFVAHVLLGVLVLVDAGWLAVVAADTSGPSHVYLPAVGLAAAIVAVGAGSFSLAGLGPADVGLAMALGWLIGVVVYAAQWRSASKTVSRVRRVRADAGVTGWPGHPS